MHLAQMCLLTAFFVLQPLWVATRKKNNYDYEQLMIAQAPPEVLFNCVIT